jgi:outer membrane protein insertion porin family
MKVRSITSAISSSTAILSTLIPCSPRSSIYIRGEVYNSKALDEKLFSNPNGGDVSSLYMDDGYLFFSITPAEVRVDGDSIDVELRINEGPQATINEVRILGNTKTNEKVIRRELRTLPGNKFSRTDLIRSQREIVNLGYFDPQQLDVVPIPNAENGTVDIEYRVTEIADQNSSWSYLPDMAEPIMV